jgi:CheY-like chemotaxis protein
MLLTTNLQQQGYLVTSARDGIQALELLHAQPFDVVLLDLLMPEMDGYQVLERMKQDPVLRHLPVIVISALDEMESVIRCIEMGAMDYLPKPFDPIYRAA